MYSVETVFYSANIVKTLEKYISWNHKNKEINKAKSKMFKAEKISSRKEKMRDLNDGIQMNEGNSVKNNFPDPC